MRQGGVISYRSEIDGLRAIAVLSVIFYHAHITLFNLPLFSGGYVGVDVFFVISGYLIGNIVMSAAERGNFSYFEFYERRIRRILPPLFFMFLVTIPLSVKYMLPQDLSEYGGSLLSSALFGSNFFFLFQDAYESQESMYKPLLHTWSLSVEEQFYIFFPPALLLIYRYFARHVMSVLVIGAVLSFSLAGYFSRTYPDLSFMMIFTRGWELLAGIITARFEIVKGRQPSKYGGHLCLAGTLLILISLFIMNDDTAHPGLMTLLPISGTVLLLWFGGYNNGMDRILKNRVFVFTGLISYSFYLWHQPVFAYLRIYMDHDITAGLKAFAIVLSYLLAVLSYYFIERPFRSKGRIDKRTVWVGAIIGILFFVGCGGWFYSRHKPEKDIFATGKAALLLQIKEAQFVSGNELKRGGQNCSDLKEGETPCIYEFGTGEMLWMTVGDSHLKPYHVPLINEFKSRDVKFVPLAGNSCMLISGIELLDKKMPCLQAYNDERLGHILAGASPVLVYGGRLPLYLSTERFDNKKGGLESGKPTLPLTLAGNPVAIASVDQVKAAVQKTLLGLMQKGVRIILVYPEPEMGWNVPRYWAKALREGAEEIGDLSVDYSVFKERTKLTYDIYDSIPDNEKLLRFYPEKYLCNTFLKGQCIGSYDGEIYYRDDDHLSYAGAQLLIPHMVAEAEKKWGFKN